MITTAQAVLSNGIHWSWLAANAISLYQKMLKPDAAPEAEPEAEDDPGMVRCVKDAIALDFQSNDSEQAYTVTQLATRFRSIHRLAWGLDEDGEPMPRELQAWNAVARWLWFAVQCDGETEAASAVATILQREQQEPPHDGDRRDAGRADESTGQAQEPRGPSTEAAPAGEPNNPGFRDPGDPANRPARGKRGKRGGGLFPDQA